MIPESELCSETTEFTPMEYTKVDEWLLKLLNPVGFLGRRFVIETSPQPIQTHSTFWRYWGKRIPTSGTLGASTSPWSMDGSDLKTKKLLFPLAVFVAVTELFRRATQGTPGPPRRAAKDQVQTIGQLCVQQGSEPRYGSGRLSSGNLT